MVVVSAATLNLVQVLFTSLTGTQTSLSDGAVTKFQSANSCSLYEDCGGCSWEEIRIPRCKLIVWTVTGGENSDIVEKIYRRQQYQRKTLIEAPVNCITIGTIFDRCDAMNAVPVLPPMTIQDKSILLLKSQPYVVLGIKRQASFSSIFTDYTGKEYETSDSTVYRWRSLGPSNGIYEDFIILNADLEMIDKKAGHLFGVDVSLLCLQK